MVIDCVLRTAGSSIIWNYADPLTSIVDCMTKWTGEDSVGPYIHLESLHSDSENDNNILNLYLSDNKLVNKDKSQTKYSKRPFVEL